MDAKSIGKIIANLRKRDGLTQSQLAEKLNVSDKAVSKWENGQGYPDITAFPALASVFGVTIDHLMLGERKGIAIAGNIIADMVKTIDFYPREGMLATISDVAPAVGGCTPNTAIDLAKIDHRIPITALGRVGMDENGRYILSQLQKYGVQSDKIVYSTTSPTSFTDVMSLPTGERTFFNKKGANTEFCPDDIDIKSLNCNIFHIGYLLLLDKFDEVDNEYGTVMARFLHDVQASGIKTSIDIISGSASDYTTLVPPSLKYCNYVIVNEIECCAVWDIEPRNADGSLNKENLYTAMQKTADAGVKDKVIVHCKEASFLLDVATNEFTAVPSLKIPDSEILGCVGAGDAFCAGSLYGIYNDFPDKQILEFASAAAACNLFAANSIDGMKDKNEIMKLSEKYGRLSL